MTGITRIRVLLSLIALVAQPAQAASYADHAKKAGRITWYTIQTIAGSLILTDYLLSAPRELRHLRRSNRPKGLPKNNLIKDVLEYITYTELSLISGPTLLYHGIKGLKNELSAPDTKPRT